MAIPLDPSEVSEPARLPTLGYALLALLSREPLTGYRLAQQLRDPIGFFWEAQHSQIYPELARLEARGFLAATSSAGPGPRPKRTYAITADGLAALRAWVGEPSRARGGRDDLLLKVYASWVAGTEPTLRLLRDAERRHAAQLAAYRARLPAERRRRVDALPASDAKFADYVTLRRGIGHERGRLAWCRWLIRKLEASRGA